MSPCPQGSARGVAGKVSLRTESRTSRVTPVLGALAPLIEKTGPARPPLPQRVRWEGSGPRGPTNRRQKPILSQAGARSPEPGLGWAELPLSLGGATSWLPSPGVSRRSWVCAHIARARPPPPGYPLLPLIRTHVLGSRVHHGPGDLMPSHLNCICEARFQIGSRSEVLRGRGSEGQPTPGWHVGSRDPPWARLGEAEHGHLLTCASDRPRAPSGLQCAGPRLPRLARRERCSQSVGHPSLQKEPRVGPVQEPPVTSHHPGWGRGGEPGEGALLSPQLLLPGLVTAPSEGVSWAVGLAPPLPSPLS